MAQPSTNPLEQQNKTGVGGSQLTDPNNPSGIYGNLAAGATQMMGAGVNLQKPAAPQGNFDLEAVRKAWAHGGQGHTGRVTPQELQDFMKNNQNILGGATLQGEKLFHNGKFIADMIGNYKSGDPNKMSRIFLDGVGSNRQPRTPAKPRVSGPINPTGPGNRPSTAGPATTAPPPTSVAPVRDPRLDELYNTLMQRSKQGLEIDRNNPVIRQQADAFSANQERSRRNYLADTAERSGPNANLRNEARMTAERVGQATGAFEGELMGRELQARRGEISEALNSMQGLLTEEQRLALTNELHRLDDATRRFGINTQNRQFYSNLGQQDRHFNADLGYRNRALDQSDAQFRDRLGFDYADRSNYWDSIYRGY